MKNIDDFFNCSILEELCEARREEFSSKVTANSKEYQELIDDTEKRIKGEKNNNLKRRKYKEKNEKKARETKLRLFSNVIKNNI